MRKKLMENQTREPFYSVLHMRKHVINQRIWHAPEPQGLLEAQHTYMFANIYNVLNIMKYLVSCV